MCVSVREWADAWVDEYWGQPQIEGVGIDDDRLGYRGGKGKTIAKTWTKIDRVGFSWSRHGNHRRSNRSQTKILLAYRRMDARFVQPGAARTDWAQARDGQDIR